MENNDLLIGCIKWVDNRKGLICIIYDNETFIVHRKNIYCEKGKILRKLKKGMIVKFNRNNINITDSDTTIVDNDEWCVL